MSLRIDATKGTVKQDIAMLRKQMLDGGLEALNEVADFMVVMARVHCRVLTGSLQKSIRKERTAPTRHNHRVIRVRAGGYIVNPKTQRLVDYAVHVERKHPFMKPAWDTVSNLVDSMIKQKVVDRVNR